MSFVSQPLDHAGDSVLRKQVPAIRVGAGHLTGIGAQYFIAPLYVAGILIHHQEINPILTQGGPVHLRHLHFQDHLLSGDVTLHLHVIYGVPLGLAPNDQGGNAHLLADYYQLGRCYGDHIGDILISQRDCLDLLRIGQDYGFSLHNPQKLIVSLRGRDERAKCEEQYG